MISYNLRPNVGGKGDRESGSFDRLEGDVQISSDRGESDMCFE